MAPRVAVVTDSAASLPDPVAQRWGIGVVPLQIIVDGVGRPEGGPGSTEQVVADLEAGVVITTSQPTGGDFADAYARAAAAGAEAIVSIHISGELSGTVNGAKIAAQEAPIPVTVVDTRTLAMAAGFSAMAAAAAAADGASADDVAAAALTAAESSICVFTVATLDYLRRGGRVSGPLAALGNALSIRPVLEIRDGEVALIERVRTTAKARDLVVQIAEKRAAELANPGLSLMGLGEQSYADDAASMIEYRQPHTGIVIRTPVSAVLAAHTGPGTLAAAVVDLPSALR